jgi:hypothetical protein
MATCPFILNRCRDISRDVVHHARREAAGLRSSAYSTWLWPPRPCRCRFGALPIGAAIGSLLGLRPDDTAVIPRLYEVFSQCCNQSGAVRKSNHASLRWPAFQMAATSRCASR